MDATSPSPDERSSLERRVDTMKQEIDALQIEVMKGSSPWYRNIPVVVSMVVAVLAFVFSLVTTILSDRRIEQEEKHQTRVELRSLIQRLISIPTENFQLERKYANDPAARAFLEPKLRAESVVLTTQAADLIDQLPGELTASEYEAVAYADFQAGVPGAGLKLVRTGIEATEDNVEEDPPGFLALLRLQGQLYFSEGRLQRGRQSFSRAMKLFDLYNEPSRFIKMTTLGLTQITWASTEINAGQCLEGYRHIIAGRKYFRISNSNPPDLENTVNTYNSVCRNKEQPSPSG
jgi:hypothetical protein